MPLNACRECGKEFTALYKREKYCSPECASIAIDKKLLRPPKDGRKVDVVCQQCGATFVATVGEKRKFCGWPCYWASKKKRIPRTCECCGKPFETNKAEMDKAHSRNAEVRYCSRECYVQALPRGEEHKWWNGGDYILRCDNCGKEFSRTRVTHKPGAYRFSFCNYACRVDYIRSHPEASPHWKGDATKEERELRKHWTYLEWRKAVFERDNYTCQKCRKRGGRLNAHHLYDFSKYPELRLLLENGHTLCKSCHLTVKGHERDYRISLGLPADNPPFQLALIAPWET